MIDVYGSENVGIKISPLNRNNSMFDSNPLETFSYLLKELDKLKIAFVELRRQDPYSSKIDKENNIIPQFTDIFA